MSKADLEKQLQERLDSLLPTFSRRVTTKEAVELKRKWAEVEMQAQWEVWRAENKNAVVPDEQIKKLELFLARRFDHQVYISDFPIEPPSKGS